MPCKRASFLETVFFLAVVWLPPAMPPRLGEQHEVRLLPSVVGVAELRCSQVAVVLASVLVAARGRVVVGPSPSKVGVVVCRLAFAAWGFALRGARCGFLGQFAIEEVVVPFVTGLCGRERPVALRLAAVALWFRRLEWCPRRSTPAPLLPLQRGRLRTSSPASKERWGIPMVPAFGRALNSLATLLGGPMGRPWRPSPLLVLPTTMVVAFASSKPLPGGSAVAAARPGGRRTAGEASSRVLMVLGSLFAPFAAVRAARRKAPEHLGLRGPGGRDLSLPSMHRLAMVLFRELFAVQTRELLRAASHCRRSVPSCSIDQSVHGTPTAASHCGYADIGGTPNTGCILPPSLPKL